MREPILPGRVMAMLFEKQSLRTRVSFEAGMSHLGGTSLFLGADVGWGKRESIADFASVLGEYVDVIVCRANSHERVEQLAKFAGCPVINGLTDKAHPCQALADLFTLQEHFGKLAGRKLAFVGDSNNVAASLAVCCGKLDMEFAIASPAGYEFEKTFLAELQRNVPNMRLTYNGRSERGRERLLRRVYRRLGQHGSGSRAGSPGQGVRAVPGERKANVARAARTPVFCTACLPVAARK